MVLLVRHKPSHELFVRHLHGVLHDKRGRVQRFVCFGALAGHRFRSPELGLDRDDCEYPQRSIRAITIGAKSLRVM